MQHQMKIMLPEKGDELVTWNPSDEKEVQKAKDTFEKYLKKGHQAFRVEHKPVKTGEPIKEFDPSIGEILLVPQYQGG